MRRKAQLVSVGDIYRGADVDCSPQVEQAGGDTFCVCPLSTLVLGQAALPFLWVWDVGVL